MFILIALSACLYSASAQSAPVLLWPNGAPGSEGKSAQETVRVNPDGEHILSNIHHPSITPYLPPAENATGAAVLVVPGGGHKEIWVDHEGYDVAKWLSSHGVAAFVLKYRLAKEDGSTYTVEGTELADTQRALRTVRSRAAEWHIDPERIGIIGFSAGGELAALASTRYEPIPASADATDAIDRLSAKPAFEGLMYPAIPHSMPLSKETPPAFMACGEDDRADISQGVAQLYLKFKQAGASAEIHIFANTAHGFGIRASNKGGVAEWPSLFLQWLGSKGFLTPN